MSALHRYELLNLLGQGGMGSVYRARERATNETVAIKLLHSSSTRARERMLREIRALASLNHESIVRVRDAGSHEGSPFVVLDFVAGETLADRVQRQGPLSSYTAAELGRDLAAALEHAHGEGVLHRDVKPDNVLLDHQGHPQLIDFGLSTQNSGEEERLTLSGALMGTPGFLSPEQAEGLRDEIGPTTDVYGLGALLYYVLTGSAPIGGSSLAELITATRYRAPQPPHEVVPGVDRRLSKIVLRCLAKSPAQRYPSAEALAQALEGFLHGSTGSRRGSPWIVAALLGVGVVAVGGGWALGKLTSDDDVPLPVAPPPSVDDEPARVDLDEVAPPPIAEQPSEELLRLRSEVQGLLAERKGEEARAVAREITRLYPEDARGYFFLGLSYMTLGDMASAVPHLRRADELHPNRASILNNLAVALTDTGHAEEALGYFERSITIDDTALARVQRGAAYEKLGRIDLALEDIRVGLELGPRFGSLLNVIRFCRKVGAAEEHMRAMELVRDAEPGYAGERYSRAELLAEYMPDVTLRDVERLLEVRPGDPASLTIKARAQLRTNLLAESLATLELIPPEVNPDPANEVRTMTYYYMGKPLEVIERWNVIVNKATRSLRCRAIVALAMIQAGQLQQAEAILAEVDAASPIHAGLQAALFNARGDHQSAMRAATIATKGGLVQPWLHGVLAHSLDKLGREADAEAIWRQLATAPLIEPELKERVRVRNVELDRDR